MPTGTITIHSENPKDDRDSTTNVHDDAHLRGIGTTKTTMLSRMMNRPYTIQRTGHVNGRHDIDNMIPKEPDTKIE